MNKTTLFSVTLLILFNPSIALACVYIPSWLLIGVPIAHFLPVVIGNIIVGKGNRLWFTAISALYYFGLYLILNTNVVQSDSSFITLMLLPYILIIVALIKKVALKKGSI